MQSFTFDSWPARKIIMKMQEDAVDDVELPSRYAYVSLMFNVDPWTLLHGLCLGCSLNDSATENHRILMVTNDVPEWALGFLRQYWQIHLVPDMSTDHIDPTLLERIPAGQYREVEAKMFLKLHVFALPYEKVCFLDLDTIVQHNIDFVFELTTPSAVSCAYNIDKYGKQILNECCLSEGLPLAAGTTFNGGVMVVKPNRAIFDVLISDVSQKSEYHMPSTHPSSWLLKNVMDWYALGADLNMSVRLTKGQSFTKEWLQTRMDSIYLVHYMGDGKPHLWWRNEKIEPFRRDWYRQVTLPSSFDMPTWKMLERRGIEALRLYSKYACAVMLRAALSTGWSHEVCDTSNITDVLRSVLLHIVKVSQRAPSRASLSSRGACKVLKAMCVQVLRSLDFSIQRALRALEA